MEPKQKQALFDEETADQLVIRSLLAEITRLKGDRIMSKIIVDNSGDLWLVHEGEKISKEEAGQLLANLQMDVDVLQKAGVTPAESANDEGTEPATSPDENAPQAPANEQPQDPNAAAGQPSQPATPEQPADSGTPAAQPSAPATSGEPTATAPATPPATPLQ